MANSAPGTRFSTLAVSSPSGLVFGQAPRPVRCGFELTIGGGQVYPEVNFTLPPITIAEATWSEVVAHYEEMAEGILRRAVALKVPGIVLEFEHLPPMTDRPAWGAEITALLRRHLERAHRADGLRSALRVTPADLRDQVRPPILRRGEAWEKVQQAFERCADAGAHILSIESVGGKEVHDEALLFGDVRGLVFGLGVLAARDMAWLWDRIGDVCRSRPGVLAGGDTACGFANTAMQLAHQGMLPEVLAAVDRALTAPRSLVAFEHGAVGPSKDCAYEGPVMKAVAGVPISMEGKSASCAHFSPLGNIAAAMCDLWSNESVQNVRLLSGNAPEAFAELLIYDCRLMNQALERGGSLTLRDWLTESDRWLSPQAVILSPEATWEIARAIAAAPDDYRRTVAAGQTAVRLLKEGTATGRLTLAKSEAQWLHRIEEELASLPATEGELIEEMTATYGRLYEPASYGLGGA
jgi:methanol--5-hydroxybenzimidazolylcobamide Co-methyltransferase